MSELAKEVLLSPDAEAERLWVGAQEAFRKGRESFAELSKAIDLGVRVVEILTCRCLEGVRNEFPATITAMLESPPPDVDPKRDFLQPPKSLRFIDAIDMLSAADMPCVSPELHRGWEDRVRSCRRSRARAGAAIGVSLDEKQRDALMVIGAYRNRIFLLPPPVRIVADEVLGAFPALVDLVERLFAAAKTPAS